MCSQVTPKRLSVTPAGSPIGVVSGGSFPMPKVTSSFSPCLIRLVVGHMSSIHLLMWVIVRAFCFSVGPTPARESVLSTDPELKKLPSDLFGNGLCTECAALAIKGSS